MCHSTHTTRSDTTLLPQLKEEKILPYPVIAQPMGDCHNSANLKSHYTSNIHFPPLDFLFTTALPKSVKEHSFSLFLWICMWFTIRSQVPNGNSLLFLNKAILLEKFLPVCLRSTISMADCLF